MEAEKQKEREEDPFSSMIKLCHPTSSQEVALSYCALARESEILVDPASSSPDPTPSPPTPILMVSQPDSPDTLPEAEEESDPDFHTPPEHRIRGSSSEEQNFVDFVDESKFARVSQKSNDDDSVSKKVTDSDLEKDTMSAEDTEEILETDSVQNSQCINLDSQETVNLGDEVGVVDNIDTEIGGEGVNSVGENHEMEKESEDVEDAVSEENLEHVENVQDLEMEKNGEDVEDAEIEKDVEDLETNEGKIDCENLHLDGRLGSGNIEDLLLRTKHILSDKFIEMREESRFGGSEEVVDKVTKAHDEIDKFAYAGGGHIERRTNRMTSIDVRQLPTKRKENAVVEIIKTKKQKLIDLLDVLDMVADDGNGDDDGSEDEDFLETAKKKGWTFSQPRWWPPEGEDN